MLGKQKTSRRRIAGALVVSVLVGVGLFVMLGRRGQHPVPGTNQITAAFAPAISADCITIENPTPQNDNGCGVLSCASQAFGSSKPIPHDSNRDAARNLGMCTKNGGDAMIIGHGVGGRIDTGSRGERQHVISVDNVPDWNSFFAGLQGKQFASLTLLGCHVGDDSQDGDGTKLLGKMLLSTKAGRVKAPTGDVFCKNSSLFFENGSTLNEVHTGSKGPQATLSANVGQMKSLTFQTDFGIPIEKIQQIEAGFKIENLRPLTVSEQNNFIDNVNFTKAEKTDACPVAATAGYATLILNSNGDKVELEVLSDGLLRDRSKHEPNVFYRGRPNFIPMWQVFLNPKQ